MSRAENERKLKFARLVNASCCFYFAAVMIGGFFGFFGV